MRHVFCECEMNRDLLEICLHPLRRMLSYLRNAIDKIYTYNLCLEQTKNVISRATNSRSGCRFALQQQCILKCHWKCYGLTMFGIA